MLGGSDAGLGVVGTGSLTVSGSEADSESGEEEEEVGGTGGGVRRGVKRERAEPESRSGAGPTGAKPGKKTRGRVKIKMEFIDNKLRRYTTFSKRKTGIMKKVYTHKHTHSLGSVQF